LRWQVYFLPLLLFQLVKKTGYTPASNERILATDNAKIDMSLTRLIFLLLPLPEVTM